MLGAEIRGEEVNGLSLPCSSVSSLLRAEIRGDEVTEFEYDRIRGVIPSIGMRGAIAKASDAMFADALAGTAVFTVCL